jgi:hypothetical protein
MEWTCTECDVTRNDPVQDLIQAGWWIGEARLGLCPSCVWRVVKTSGTETVRRAQILRDSARETLALIVEAVGDVPFGAENRTRQ